MITTQGYYKSFIRVVYTYENYVDHVDTILSNYPGLIEKIQAYLEQCMGAIARYSYYDNELL